MKTYKIKNKTVTQRNIKSGLECVYQMEGEVEISEQEIRNLLKENPELLTPTHTHKRKYFVPKTNK